MKPRSLLLGQASQGSQVVEEKILKPLKQLNELLAGLEEIIARFEINFGLVKDTAAPSFSNKILTFIGQKEEISEENKAVYVDLIAQIDPNNWLLHQLDLLQKQLASYRLVVSDLEKPISQLIDGSLKQIAHHVAICAENLLKRFEADYNRYVDVERMLSEYLKFEEKCQTDCKWIDDDLKVFSDCEDKAKKIIQQVESLDVSKIKFNSFNQDSLRKIESLKIKLNDEQPFIVIKNNIEEILHGANELLRKSEADLSLLEVKKEIEEDLKRLHDFLDYYKKIEAEYSTLNIGKIQQDSAEIKGQINEFLQEAENFNNINEEKIFKCLLYYHEYAGSEDDAVRSGAESQLSRLLLERTRLAEDLRVKALPLVVREAQFQRELTDVWGKLNKLNQDSDKEIFSDSQLDWSQPQSFLFEVLPRKLGTEIIRRRNDFINERFYLLDKKEIDLTASNLNANMLVDSAKNTIKEFFQCLSADVLDGLLGGVEYHDESHLQSIVSKIKNLKTNLATVKELENNIVEICNEIAGLEYKKDKDDFYIKKVDNIWELLQRDIIRFNKNIKCAIEIEQEWKDFFHGDAEKFATAFAGFKLLPIIDAERFKAATVYIDKVLSGFPSLSLLLINEKFDHLNEYTTCINDINSIIDSLSNLKKTFNNDLNENYFHQLSDNLQHILRINEMLKDAVNKERVGFVAHYNKRIWPAIEKARQKTVPLEQSYPAKLKQNIESLTKSITNLYGHQALRDKVITDQEKLKEFSSVIEANLAALNNYKNYLEFYDASYSLYEKWASIIGDKVAEIKKVLEELMAQKCLLEELAGNNKKCLYLIPSLEESIRQIINKRLSVTEGLKNANLSDWFNKLKAAVAKINDEEIFANNAKLMLKNLSNLKQKEMDAPKEIFSLLWREFIFSGRSRAIIEKLKSHGKLAQNQNRAKGNLIINFINNLTNPDHITDISHMADFLADENNKELIQNTGYTKMLGCSSTTASLLNELRTEWMGLVRRENAGNRGSIRYALKNDYNQIKDEYQKALNEKKITLRVDAIGLKYTYERFTQYYLTDEPDDHLPLAIWKKIQQDCMDIRRWSGVDKSSLPLRHIRMQCARLIREAEDLSRRQEDFHQQLKLAAKNYPFTFAYQSLKCHLERNSSNRSGSIMKLWKMLDEIAFGEGDESNKYGKMRESILDFYKNLREKPNGSAGFFFGKGSKLGDGLETFLKMPQSPTESYEWGLGYTADQVHHRRPETNLDRAVCWMRDQIFCCIPR